MPRKPSGSSARKPAKPRRPVCGYSDGRTSCERRGDHFCAPRADWAQAFIEEILVHTKADWARKPFVLDDWQRDEIIRPVFGSVRWDPERGRYVRCYQVVWIEIARKNGKSELLAAVALYLLIADDEEGAEIYGAAKDTEQARKVWDVAERMVKLSPQLRQRLRDGAIVINKQEKRIIYEPTGSYYQVITADAAGELGHNPHGIVFDEILTQRTDALWNALRTSMGARPQPLMVAATTAGNDPGSFAAVEHAEMERIAKDPKRAPHVFVYLRNTPKKADPWDEKNWAHANPALGRFLSIQALRNEALEARNNPRKENAFRQFRLNQWVQQVTRWLPLDDWRASAGLVDEDLLRGRDCYGGLDLAATTDLAALCWTFPEGFEAFQALWRFWVPEERIPYFDEQTAGQFTHWVRDGFVRATSGNVIEFGLIEKQILADAKRFQVQTLAFDPYQAVYLAQNLADAEIPLLEHGQRMQHLSPSTKQLLDLVLKARYRHGGNPVMEWMIDNVVVRADEYGNIKPDRRRSGGKIDGVVAAIMSLTAAYQPREDEIELTGTLFA